MILPFKLVTGYHTETSAIILLQIYLLFHNNLLFDEGNRPKTVEFFITNTHLKQKEKKIIIIFLLQQVRTYYVRIIK